MPRLMSVALTEDAVRARTKTVTRRLGWANLQPGTRLTLCRKVMGRKRSDGTVEPLVRICDVEVVAVRRERLDAIDADEVTREGFAGQTPEEFVWFFVEHMRCDVESEVTRIEWRYLDGGEDVAAPICDGLCITAADIGVPSYGIAYPHPGCPLDDPDHVCECEQPDRCLSPTHGQVTYPEAREIFNHQKRGDR